MGLGGIKNTGSTLDAGLLCPSAKRPEGRA